jgi:hypothetical protein
MNHANNNKTRAHVYEIAAQRITGYTDPSYIGDDMLRGHEEEIEARTIYEQNYAAVINAGFIIRDFGGCTIGYSPDGLIGDHGLIECKSRRQYFQIQTISGGGMPDDFTIQVQTGLLVSDRLWCDFISYCGGLPMAVFRVFPDKEVQEAILKAATKFEEQVADVISKYRNVVAQRRFINTDRRIEQEMVI